MGDVLVTSSLFPLLRKKFPEAELHYLILKNNAPILENNPFIDHLVFYEKGLSKNIHAIKEHHYDIIVDVYSKIGTALITYFSGAKQTTGYYKNYLQFFYKKPMKRKLKAISSLTALALEHRLQLVEPLGISFEEIQPKIYVSEAEKENAKNLLLNFGVDFSKKIVMISTFGSSVEKTYPYMNQVIDHIAEHNNLQILCNYLPSQKESFQTLYNQLNENSKSKIIKDFDTKNLREYIAVVSHCDALIGNEGGSTNMSKALEIPTFGIFAPFIDKKTWSWAEDGIKNTSVHIHDFISNNDQPEDFKFNLFKDQLDQFLQNNLA